MTIVVDEDDGDDDGTVNRGQKAKAFDAEAIDAHGVRDLHGFGFTRIEGPHLILGIGQEGPRVIAVPDAIDVLLADQDVVDV